MTTAVKLGETDNKRSKVFFGNGTFRRFSDNIVAGGCFFSRQRYVFKSRLRILDLRRNILSGKRHPRLKSGILATMSEGKKSCMANISDDQFAVRRPGASLRSPLSPSPFPGNVWGIMGKCLANRNVLCPDTFR